MKPLSRIDDGSTLQELGKASIQIVHDLKNQLNGLKLYATFLRRRIEKSERPDDEQETVGKLINGLNRAAEDLSLIVRYGQPVELKKQAGVDVNKLLHGACVEVVMESSSEVFQGSFDHFKLGDAFKYLCAGAIKYKRTEDGAGEVTVTARPA